MQSQSDITRKILVLGTSSFAVEVADLIADTPGFDVAGFVENLEKSKAGTLLDGCPVIWIDDAAVYRDTHLAVCGLGTTMRSAFVAQAESVGLSFETVIHPAARLSSRSTIGDGSVLSVAAIVAAHSRIGRHVVVNRGAIIGHHAVVGDYTSVMSGANIGGNSTVGEGVYVGMSSVVLNDLTVGAHSVIAAGAVVTQDVPPNVMVAGVPAIIKKRDIQGK